VSLRTFAAQLATVHCSNLFETTQQHGSFGGASTMMPHPKALAEYLDQTVLDCGGWGKWSNYCSSQLVYEAKK
jgi:hypothetical protein